MSFSDTSCNKSISPTYICVVPQVPLRMIFFLMNQVIPTAVKNTKETLDYFEGYIESLDSAGLSPVN